MGAEDGVDLVLGFIQVAVTGAGDALLQCGPSRVPLKSELFDGLQASGQLAEASDALVLAPLLVGNPVAKPE